LQWLQLNLVSMDRLSLRLHLVHARDPAGIQRVARNEAVAQLRATQLLHGLAGGGAAAAAAAAGPGLAGAVGAPPPAARAAARGARPR